MQEIEMDIKTPGINQKNILLISFLVSCICSLCTLNLINFLDPNRYYVSYGINGPFSVVIPPDDLNDKYMGKANNLFHQNDWLGYKSDVSIEKDVAVLVSVTLVDAKYNIISGEQFLSNVDSRRTGSKDFFFHIPANIADGTYYLMRKAIFKPKFGIPSSAMFPTLEFEVK